MMLMPQVSRVGAAELRSPGAMGARSSMAAQGTPIALSHPPPAGAKGTPTAFSHPPLAGEMPGRAEGASQRRFLTRPWQRSGRPSRALIRIRQCKWTSTAFYHPPPAVRVDAHRVLSPACGGGDARQGRGGQPTAAQCPRAPQSQGPEALARWPSRNDRRDVGQLVNLMRESDGRSGADRLVVPAGVDAVSDSALDV